jgi:hypothetical protein
MNLVDLRGPDVLEGLVSPYSTPVSTPEVLAGDSGALEEALWSRLSGGDRSAMVPLVILLVSSGCPERACAVMEGRGLAIPATRRDLAIALAWYGRYALNRYLVLEQEPPADLELDDVGGTIAAVLAAGWMSTAPDGLFHPGELASRRDLDAASSFFPGGPLPDRRWISTTELDEWLGAAEAPGSGER